MGRVHGAVRKRAGSNTAAVHPSHRSVSLLCDITHELRPHGVCVFKGWGHAGGKVSEAAGGEEQAAGGRHVVHGNAVVADRAAGDL